MSGIQEILLIVALILGIFFLPRLLPSRKAVQAPPRRRPMPGGMRMAIVVSILWPAASAAYLQPWQGGLFRFLYIALGPLAIGWSLWWIKRGYRESRRS
ncbi:MAG: hypothetical protein PVH30_03080 [Desulfobacterales bacterium]